jgi:hypothetical protein
VPRPIRGVLKTPTVNAVLVPAPKNGAKYVEMDELDEDETVMGKLYVEIPVSIFLFLFTSI